jgi:hypothetical protein
VSGPANVSNDERTGAAAVGLEAAAGAARDCGESGRARVGENTHFGTLHASMLWLSLSHLASHVTLVHVHGLDESSYSCQVSEVGACGELWTRVNLRLRCWGGQSTETS